jgi:Fusaric acid resistance protein family
LLIAAVTNVVFRTIDPAWNALRISRAGWRAVSRLARDGRVDIRRWTLQMFDRMGLVTARLKNADPKSVESRHIDGLRDMRVGLNIAALREAAPEQASASAATAQPTVSRAPELDDVLSLIAATYAARANRIEEPSAMTLERAIDAGISALAAQGLTDARTGQPIGPPNTPAPTTPTLTPRHLTGLAALTSLRLDLAPASAPYTRTVPAT